MLKTMNLISICQKKKKRSMSMKDLKKMILKWKMTSRTLKLYQQSVISKISHHKMKELVVTI